MRTSAADRTRSNRARNGSRRNKRLRNCATILSDIDTTRGAYAGRTPDGTVWWTWGRPIPFPEWSESARR